MEFPVENKKSLVGIIGDTIRPAVVTGTITASLFYLVNGLSAALSQNVTFADKLKDPSTAAAVVGMGIGAFLGTSLFYGAKALAERYKIERRQINL